jgi:hypothetical protein
MPKTFEQPNISTGHVVVAAPRVFIANYGAVPDYTAGTGDVPYGLEIAAAVVTDGWYDMGAIDTVTMPVTKDFVRYEAGATRTIRKQYERSRSAQLTFNYREMMPYVKAFCTGTTIFNTVATQAATQLTGSPTTTAISVTSATGLAVGDTIGIAPTSGGIPTTYNLCVITAINGTALTVTGLQSAPTSSDFARKIVRTEYNDPIGTITERTALMFFDYEVTAGKTSQYLVWFPRLITNSAYAPDFKDTNDYMMAPVSFEAMSTTQTLDDGTSKLVLYRAWDIGQV